MKRIRGDDSSMDSNRQEHDMNLWLAESLKRLNVDAIIMNDFTNADLAVRAVCGSDRWMKIQVKTTRSHVIGKPNCWQFDQIKGYSGMLVCCLVCDTDSRCWLYTGDYLDAIKPVNVCVVPGGKHDRAAIADGSRKAILDTIVRCCWLSTKTQLDRPVSPSLTNWGGQAESFPLHTELDCRTEFRSDAHKKEYALIRMWKSFVCDPAGWLLRLPDGSGLVYDQLLSKDHGNTWLRVQLKSASPRRVNSGYRGKLTKSAGFHGGKKKSRPYAVGDADEYVFLYHEEGTRRLDVWSFNEMELNGNQHPVPCISSESGIGTGHIPLHLPLKEMRSTDVVPCTKIVGNGGYISKNLWTRSNHKRFDW